MQANGHELAENGSPHYTWLTTWTFAASPARVWQAISRPDEWPRWWPYVAEVRLLRAGDEDDLGAVRRFVWRTRLPYRVRFDAETLAVEQERLLVARAMGDVDGQGTWRLYPEALDNCVGTRVDYEWRILLDQPWMRRLAPIAAPVFKWNHDGVMRAGAAGLKRYLQSTAES